MTRKKIKLDLSSIERMKEDDEAAHSAEDTPTKESKPTKSNDEFGHLDDSFQKDVYVMYEIGDPKKPKPLFPEDDNEREQYPAGTFLTTYFPHAQAAKAHHSWKSNEKHNPGEPMHWAKDKSIGGPDRIVRHLMEGVWAWMRGDREGAKYHFTALAWRADEYLERFLTGMEPFNKE